MNDEHKRPLAAFIVVSLLGALLLGQSLHSQSAPTEANHASSPKASIGPTSSSVPSGRPSNGQAVDGLTMLPPELPVKSIAPAPRLIARGDAGQDISSGGRGPDRRPADSGDAPTPDLSPAPEVTDPPETPMPGPSEPPPDPGSSPTRPGHGGHQPPSKPPSHAPVPTTPPHGPRDDVAPPAHQHGSNGVAPDTPSPG